MYTLTNLSDADFEGLCRDILSKELRVELRRFGRGRDHGVDLTDDVSQKNIVVQVKHYAHSTVSNLMTSLKSELTKIPKMDPVPKDYFVCCSLDLSADKQKEIYTLFSKYMHSSKNVYDLTWINEFLNKSENEDILYKNYKIWMESTNVLDKLLSKDICVDCEVLISDINSHKNLYVQTKAYQNALSMLNKIKVLMIVGSPGVGKTTTSEMLVLKYLDEDYHLRYTTNTTDLKALKTSLSSHPEVKEIVLLDDCFGQAYFKMEETQTNELVSLIKYISASENKKLILNSRITIYNTAVLNNRKFMECIDRKEYSFLLLDLDQQPLIDRAFILYNHLIVNEIGQEYKKDISNNKNYLKIVKHQNYNPRLIEYVTKKDRVEKIVPSEYSNFIFHNLEHPDEIWKEEYEARILPEDQVFLQTLFSLTDTTVNEKLLQKCYERRIKKELFFVSTKNQFQCSKKRLLDSMITITPGYNKEELIRVSNPSINDFLDGYIRSSDAMVNTILDNASSVHQIKRMIREEDSYIKKIDSLFKNNAILDFEYDNYKQKCSFLTYYCIKFQIKKPEYSEYITDFLKNVPQIDIFNRHYISVSMIFKDLFQPDFCSFYNLDMIINDISCFESILSKLWFEDFAEFINCSFPFINPDNHNKYADLIDSIIYEKITEECNYISASDYDVNVYEIVRDNQFCTDDGEDFFDRENAVMDIKDAALDAHIKWIEDNINKLPEVFSYKREIDKDEFEVEDAESLLSTYLDDYEYDRDDFSVDSVAELNQIDNLFNWE